jgi:hypothetical protein
MYSSHTCWQPGWLLTCFLHHSTGSYCYLLLFCSSVCTVRDTCSCGTLQCALCVGTVGRVEAKLQYRYALRSLLRDHTRVACCSAQPPSSFATHDYRYSQVQICKLYLSQASPLIADSTIVSLCPLPNSPSLSTRPICHN